jgi:Flp pilus assembly CpaE family ATPase
MFSALLISPTSVRCQILKSVAMETGQLLLARMLEEYPRGIGLTKLMHLEPEVVLLDLDGDESALKCAGEIRQRSPRTPILGFTEQPSCFDAQGLAGLDFVLPFPPAPEELARCVNEVVRQSPFDAKENLLAFLPAKAGSGATTIVRNTAAALAELPGKRVLIIEGDCRSGVLSFLLDEKVEGSLQEVLTAPGELDGFRLDRAVTERDGVAAILSDRTVPEPAPGWEVYARLVEVATSRYDPVLVDLPETFPPEAREILRRAGKIILVSTPDVVALKLAERAYNELILSGVPKNRIHVVLNRWEEDDLGPREVEEFLHRPVLHLFPNDDRAVRISVLRGEALPPKSGLWKSFQVFAAKLTAAAHPSPETLGARLRSVLHREAWR